MELLPQEIKDVLPKIGATEEVENPKVVFKLFLPEGRATWFIMEGEQRGNDWLLYCYVRSPLGPDCDEFGYVVLSELQSLRGPVLRLPVERDLHWDNTTTIDKVLNGSV